MAKCKYPTELSTLINAGGLPGETQVYSYNRGWIPIAHLRHGEMILTRDIVSHESLFSIPTVTGTFQYTGPVFEYDSGSSYWLLPESQRILCTDADKLDAPNRKDVLCTIRHWNHKYTRDPLVRTFNWNKPSPERDKPVYISPRISVPYKDGQWIEPRYFPGITLDRTYFMRFLAWYLAEGCTAKGQGHARLVIITQLDIPGVNQETRALIKETIEKMSPNGELHASMTPHGVNINNTPLAFWLYLLGKAHQKHIPENIFRWFDKEYAKDFLDVYSISDGMRRARKDGRDSFRFFTVSPVLADQLQMLSLMAGFASGIRIDKRKMEQHHDKLIISASQQRRYLHSKSRYLHKTPYNGLLYLLTVPTHCVLIRQRYHYWWVGDHSDMSNS